MTSWKVHSSILFLILSLVGCSNNKTDNEISETSTLSFVNPIDDITLLGNTSLDFSIPEDTCNDDSDTEINYSLSISNNVGFTLVEGIQLTGVPTDVGVVDVVVTCYTTIESVTDEFTITVEDFEADPVVEITAPNLANVDAEITLTATAVDTNFTGLVVSYEWEQVSGPDIDFTSTNTASTSFITPDTTEQSSVVFLVRVTDNDGDTATDSVEIDLISSLAPSVSLFFPPSLGIYNQDLIDMFGSVDVVTGDIVDATGNEITVDLIIDTIEYPAVITDDTWRVENVTVTETADIKVLVTSTKGFINYQEITVVSNGVYSTPIDNSISDVAVNESTDEIYVQLNGDLSDDTKLAVFNLTSEENSILTVSQPDNYAYSDHVPTSIMLEETTDNLFVSYASAISKIDLTTGNETLLSDSGKGSGTFPQLVMDLAYNTTSNTLYATDIDAQTIYTVNTSTGSRSDIIVNLDRGVSVAADSTTGNLYYSQGTTTTVQTLIKENDATTSSSSTIYNIAAGDEGGPISDIAINEVDEVLFFVDGSGSLIQLNLADNSTEDVIENLFVVENIVDEQTPLIGLHYHSGRNVLIAAGKDADGTNKLLVIDPISGDYVKVATGE